MASTLIDSFIEGNGSIIMLGILMEINNISDKQKTKSIWTWKLVEINFKCLLYGYQR